MDQFCRTQQSEAPTETIRSGVIHARVKALKEEFQYARNITSIALGWQGQKEWLH